MQVSWAPVAAKAAQDPQDIWFLTDVTKPKVNQWRNILRDYIILVGLPGFAQDFIVSSVFLSLCLTVSLCLCCSIFLSLCLTVSLCLCCSVSLSPFVPLSLCLSATLFFCLSVSFLIRNSLLWIQFWQQIKFKELWLLLQLPNHGWKSTFIYIDIISPMFYVYKSGCPTKNEPQQQAISLGVGVYFATDWIVK